MIIMHFIGNETNNTQVLQDQHIITKKTQNFIENIQTKMLQMLKQNWRQSTVVAEHKMQLSICIQVIWAKSFDQVTFICKHWYEARHRNTYSHYTIRPLVVSLTGPCSCGTGRWDPVYAGSHATFSLWSESNLTNCLQASVLRLLCF